GGAAVLGTSDGRIRVAAVVGDGRGRRKRVGAAHRRIALVAGDGHGAVVAWGGVEHELPPPWWCWGRGRVRLAQQGSRPLPGQGGQALVRWPLGLGALC